METAHSVGTTLDLSKELALAGSALVVKKVKEWIKVVQENLDKKVLEANAGDGVNHVARIKAPHELHRDHIQTFLLEKERNYRVEGDIVYV
jgi:hypothetical protein